MAVTLPTGRAQQLLSCSFLECARTAGVSLRELQCLPTGWEVWAVCESHCWRGEPAAPSVGSAVVNRCSPMDVCAP